MSKLKFRQVHLDFHTSEHIENIGAEFNADEFAKTLNNAHVNSITCFSKCHHGWSYHKTSVGKSHPHLKCELLPLQIEACHKANIKVPVYKGGPPAAKRLRSIGVGYQYSRSRCVPCFGNCGLRLNIIWPYGEHPVLIIVNKPKNNNALYKAKLSFYTFVCA